MGLQGLTGSAVLVIGYLAGYNGSEIDFRYIFQAMLAAITTGIFTLLFNLSFAYGLAGPASALCQAGPMVQTLLATILLRQVPNVVEIVAFALGLAGVLAITLGKFAYKAK